MTGALYYPPADRSQWYGSGNATVSPSKILWHTTETPGGWPAYAGGTMAPNLTYDPWRHLWRQHFPLNASSRALKNGASYQTNRMGVCQVEISCYCDPARMGPYHVSRLDQQAYDDMGAFAEFMRREWGVPLSLGVAWKPYPASYGASNGVRLSRSQFAAYRGHLAHQNAPDNLHGDGGALDGHRILAAAGGTTPEPPKPPEEPMADYIAAATVPAEGGKVYLLVPSKAPQWLSPAQWQHVCRVTPYWASLPGSPFFTSQIMELNAMIQPDGATRALTLPAASEEGAAGVTLASVPALAHLMDESAAK